MLKNCFLVLLVVSVCIFSTFAQENVTSGSVSNENTSNNSNSQQSSNIKTRKFEVGIQFSSLMKRVDGDRNGVGLRLGYNLATFGNGKYVVTAEAEMNYFTGEKITNDFRRDGRVTQGLFGVKIGRKFEKFGIFGKVRPGFVKYSAGDEINWNNPFSYNYRTNKGKTNFATDIGGVLEFYPTKRIITRFDFGDTIVRLQEKTVSYTFLNGSGQPQTASFVIPAKTTHNFQFNAGIGFRF